MNTISIAAAHCRLGQSMARISLHHPSVTAWAGPVGKLGNELIPGLIYTDAWCLWLTPADDALSTDLFGIGLSAMRGQAGLVWHASAAGWRSVRLSEKLRALGSYGTLIGGDTLARSTFDFPDKH